MLHKDWFYPFVREIIPRKYQLIERKFHPIYIEIEIKISTSYATYTEPFWVRAYEKHLLVLAMGAKYFPLADPDSLDKFKQQVEEEYHLRQKIGCEDAIKSLLSRAKV